MEEPIENTSERQEYQRREKLFGEYLHSDEMQEKRLTRLKIADATARKNEARVLTWQLCMREDNPAEGCIFFIENFGWTIDPRRNPKHIPFFLFEYQKEAVRYLVDHIDGEKDLLLEKSRDMGVTWLVVWVYLWYWLFRDGANLLMGSYKERLVDDRSIDSMMGKVDYALQSLPKWLLPRGFRPHKHRTKLRLVNPLNNNLISGDTMNPDFGRGSRKTSIFYDELGFWDYAKESWESGGDSTPCRIANSTPHGHNYYARLRNSGIDVLTLHWSQHPLKDDEWYEFEKERRTEEEVAQELDISYTKSREGRVYPEWNENNVSYGQFEYNPTLPLYVGWDYGKEDPTAIIWAQPFENRLRIVDAYTKNGKTIDFYIPFIIGIVPSDNYVYTKEELEIIERHKNWKKGVHFGDPAGRFGNAVSDATVFSVLREAGIMVNYNDNWKTHQNRKRAAKHLIMNGIEINQNERTEYLNLCMENATYPTVLREGVREIRSDKPLHNWACLRGDTEIRTLNGWIEIKDLVDKEFWVWGYSESEGRLVPTKATKCWKTSDKAPLLEIVLDNKISLFVTPEHRIMKRDGSYERADRLNEGDSVMPYHKILYIRQADPAPVYDIETDTHNFVANGVVVHNSHFRSAFEYLALGLENFTHRTSKPKDMFEFKSDYQNGRRRGIRY